MQNGSDTKICPKCGSVNKAAYIYCNECGTPLNSSPQQQFNGSGRYETTGTGYAQYNNYSQCSTGFSADNTVNFDGVSAADVFDYTGRNIKYYSTLEKMRIGNRTAWWNWPVFILGVLFGFVGIGAYMLYRKLYKTGLLLIAVGVIQNVFSAVRASEIYSGMSNIISQKGSIASSEDLQQLLSQLSTVKAGTWSNLISQFFFFVSFTSVILFAILINKLYTDLSVKRIKRLRLQDSTLSCCSFGGTNIGLAVGIASLVLIADAVCIGILSAPVFEAIYEMASSLVSLY